MKQRYFNWILFLVALGSGIGVFTLKYYVLGKEKELKKIYTQISQNQKELHGLETEWASFTNPAELRRQAKQIDAQTLLVQQIITPNQLENRPVSVPDKKPEMNKEETDVKA